MNKFAPVVDVRTAYELLAKLDRPSWPSVEFQPSATATLLDLDLHLYEWFETDQFGRKIRGTDQARMEARQAGTAPDPFLGGEGLICSFFCDKGLKAAATQSMRPRTPAPDPGVWFIAQALARPLFRIPAIPQDPLALFERITVALERKRIGSATRAPRGASRTSTQRQAKRRL